MRGKPEQPGDGLGGASTSAASPRVAVVVCTRGRPWSVRRFLASLAAQGPKPAQLIIVDASLTDETERILRDYGSESLAERVEYSRVPESLRGLTRQRNFALQKVATEMVAFFDDDVVLLPGCLRSMEEAHQLMGDRVVGVGALVVNQPRRPTWLWRLRRLLWMVPDLRAGSFHRSGISVPWSFVDGTGGFIEGDWLPGCAMMWRTEIARELGFNERFDGYAAGEDLDFSLRAGKKGRLVLAGSALVEHLDDPNSRPDPYTLGYMFVYNHFRIHREAFPDQKILDRAWFLYASTLEALLLARYVFSPRQWTWAVKQMTGQFRAVYDVLRDR